MIKAKIYKSRERGIKKYKYRRYRKEAKDLDRTRESMREHFRGGCDKKYSTYNYSSMLKFLWSNLGRDIEEVYSEFQRTFSGVLRIFGKNPKDKFKSILGLAPCPYWRSSLFKINELGKLWLSDKVFNGCYVPKLKKKVSVKKDILDWNRGHLIKEPLDKIDPEPIKSFGFSTVCKTLEVKEREYLGDLYVRTWWSGKILPSPVPVYLISGNIFAKKKVFPYTPVEILGLGVADIKSSGSNWFPPVITLFVCDSRYVSDESLY